MRWEYLTPDTDAEALQWGRRVNTAEWSALGPVDDRPVLASMGPPREHGGMFPGGNTGGNPNGGFNGAAA